MYLVKCTGGALAEKSRIFQVGFDCFWTLQCLLQPAVFGRLEAVAFHTSKRLVRRRLLRHVGHMRGPQSLRHVFFVVPETH